MIRRLTTTALLVFLTMSAAVAAVFEGNGNGYAYSERGVEFRYWTAVNVSTLVGEPIVDARVRWEIDARQSKVVLPSFWDENAEDQTVRLSLLSNGEGDLAAPMSVWPKIYNLKLAYVFRHTGGRLSADLSRAMIIADVGVLGPPDGKEWSFNISGSPNWSNFLVRGDRDSDIENPTYFGEADAKSFIRDMELVGIRIVDIDVSFFDIQNWYAENSPYAQVIGLRTAYTQMRRAMKNIAGYDLPKNHAADELMGTGRTMNRIFENQNASGSLLRAEEKDRLLFQRLLTRLINVPDEMLAGANKSAFQSAADEAVETFQSLTEKNRRFVSSERNTSSISSATAPRRKRHSIRSLRDFGLFV